MEERVPSFVDAAREQATEIMDIAVEAAKHKDWANAHRISLLALEQDRLAKAFLNIEREELLRRIKEIING